ncbi:MAG: FAD:protein FMN transferase [Coriobacteriia bacterium]|nr:FAD:protein FMN transferase [Coriobacteriia bacterium]
MTWEKTNANVLAGSVPLSRRRFLGFAAVAGLTAAFGLPGCSAEPEENPSGTIEGELPLSPQEFEEQTRTVFLFDTVVTLDAYCSKETMDAAVGRCGYFESIFSRTRESSDIGRINEAKGEPVEVAPETADIITKALAYCEESEGRFDITIGAATTLWDFKEGVVPKASALEKAVKHIDYTKVLVDGTTVQLLDPKAKLDLGGIAKGYIADDLCRGFIEAGCDSGFVNLGGNVKTIGLKPDGSPWHVGVQDPNDVHDTVVAAVYSQDTSVVTSGLYERRFEKDGKDYWHILDPKTGYPVETDLVSATIISDASLDGDGYTKPLFMMGKDEAIAWINAKPGIEGMVVGSDGSIVQSNGCSADLY